MSTKLEDKIREKTYEVTICETCGAQLYEGYEFRHWETAHGDEVQSERNVPVKVVLPLPMKPPRSGVHR